MVIRVCMLAVKGEEGEEAGVGEVSKVCVHNRPLEAPLPDHRATDRQNMCLLMILVLQKN